MSEETTYNEILLTPKEVTELANKLLRVTEDLLGKKATEELFSDKNVICYLDSLESQVGR